MRSINEGLSRLSGDAHRSPPAPVVLKRSIILNSEPTPVPASHCLMSMVEGVQGCSFFTIFFYLNIYRIYLFFSLSPQVDSFEGCPGFCSVLLQSLRTGSVHVCCGGIVYDIGWDSLPTCALRRSGDRHWMHDKERPRLDSPKREDLRKPSQEIVTPMLLVSAVFV